MRLSFINCESVATCVFSEILSAFKKTLCINDLPFKSTSGLFFNLVEAINQIKTTMMMARQHVVLTTSGYFHNIQSCVCVCGISIPRLFVAIFPIFLFNNNNNNVCHPYTTVLHLYGRHLTPSFRFSYMVTDMHIHPFAH